MPILALDNNGEIDIEATRARLAVMSEPVARDIELRLDVLSYAIEVIRDLLKSTPEDAPLRLQFAQLYGSSMGLFALKIEGSDRNSLYLSLLEVSGEIAAFAHNCSRLFPSEMEKVSQMLFQVESILADSSQSNLPSSTVSAIAARLGLL